MHDNEVACASCWRGHRVNLQERFMPRRVRNVVALAALGTFIIAGSQAQAAAIGNVFRGSISHSNGAYIAHLPAPSVPRKVPNVLPPQTVHPHPNGAR
jgi:hypothetical protein